MGFWPVSFSFEVFFAVYPLFLLDGGLLSRVAAVFGFIIELPLFSARQVIWLENAGTFSYVTLVYPSLVTGLAFLFFLIMGYVAVANVLAFFHRDMFGRKREVLMLGA